MNAAATGQTSRGERPDPHLGEIEPDLDAWELALAQEADARAMPMLGICRGAQAMNVARGGSLHQHVANVAGAVEAIEGAGPALFLGVQWHAEGLIDDARHSALFSALIDAATERRVEVGG